ncbi:MAG: ROK family protein [Pseudomonadota bacterium]
MTKYFCLDIGGSLIKLGIGTADTFSQVKTVSTPMSYDAFVLSVTESLISAGISAEDALGLSIAGTVDIATGAIRAAQLPYLAEADLAADLHSALATATGGPLRKSILVENDADCFAIAEAHLGAGRGFDNVFAIILGTGVGGAQIYRGELIRGFGQAAGEWGHGPFVQDQDFSSSGYVPRFACACGQAGCIDTVGGARGLEALHAAARNPSADSHQIVSGWRDGDPACSGTVETYVSIVSDALALTVNITGAEIVPVGGGLSNAKDLIDALDAAVRAKTLAARNAPLIVIGETGPSGGLLGIYTALQKEKGRQ